MGQQQLDTVLRVRRHQRNQVRMALAQIIAEARRVEDRRQGTEQDRNRTIETLQTSTAMGPLDVDRAAGLRYHAARLSIELAEIAAASATHAERVRTAQAMLARADQAVKAVEMLQQRQAAERRLLEERRADRDATDRYSAMKSAAESTG